MAGGARVWLLWAPCGTLGPWKDKDVHFRTHTPKHMGFFTHIQPHSERNT